MTLTDVIAAATHLGTLAAAAAALALWLRSRGPQAAPPDPPPPAVPPAAPEAAPPAGETPIADGILQLMRTKLTRQARAASPDATAAEIDEDVSTELLKLMTK